MSIDMRQLNDRLTNSGACGTSAPSLNVNPADKFDLPLMYDAISPNVPAKYKNY